MKKLMLLLPLFCLFFAFAAKAAEAVTPTAAAGQEQAKYPYTLIAPPIPGYSNETGWSALLVGMVLYMDGEINGVTFPSMFFPKITYTQKNQLDVALELDHYGRNNDWFLKALAEYKRIPDNFYGIGNNNPASAAESYTLESMIGWLEFYKKITGVFHAGARFRFQKDNMVESEAGGLLSAGGVPGSRGGFSTGFGLLLKMDDRDNTMLAMEGNYDVLSAEFFGPSLGGSNSFELYTVDLRKYFRLSQNQSIGAHLFSENLTGHPPFNFLSLFGGSCRLRGYTMGRYRDMMSFYCTAEYKYILLDWLALTGFTGFGDAGPRWGPELVIKYSAGMGARIIIDKGNRTNLRVDFAYGKDGPAFYIDLADSF
jgi:outer membrane protein assembly factor BamA